MCADSAASLSQPGMERVFFTGLYRFSYSSISKGHHHHKIFWVNMECRRDRRLRADFAIFQHKADGILCHADSFVHGIALGEAALNIGNLNRVPGFFQVKNCRIENSVHNVTSLILLINTQTMYLYNSIGLHYWFGFVKQSMQCFAVSECESTIIYSYFLIPACLSIAFSVPGFRSLCDMEQ